jgi:hypothetical protein
LQKQIAPPGYTRAIAFGKCAGRLGAATWRKGLPLTLRVAARHASWLVAILRGKIAARPKAAQGIVAEIPQTRHGAGRGIGWSQFCFTKLLLAMQPGAESPFFLPARGQKNAPIV